MAAIYLMGDGAGHWPVAWRAPTPPRTTLRCQWHYLGLIEDEHVAALLQALRDRPGLRREVALLIPASGAAPSNGDSSGSARVPSLPQR